MFPQPGGPGGPADELRRQLLARRVVLLRGALDDDLAGRVVAELLLLADGEGPVTLHVDSAGGPLHAAFAVVDTVDSLPVPVEAVCIGRAEGSAALVVVAAPRRRIAAHGRMRLCEPSTSVGGRAADLATWSAQHAREVDLVVRRLAEASGRPLEHVEADVAARRWFTADEAVAHHLVDGVWSSGR